MAADRYNPLCTYTPYVGDQYAVDTTQLDVDFQAQVGEGLGRGTIHILQLHTLCGHTQLGVSHTLHLGYESRGRPQVTSHPQHKATKQIHM